MTGARHNPDPRNPPARRSGWADAGFDDAHSAPDHNIGLHTGTVSPVFFEHDWPSRSLSFRTPMRLDRLAVKHRSGGAARCRHRVSHDLLNAAPVHTLRLHVCSHHAAPLRRLMLADRAVLHWCGRCALMAATMTLQPVALRNMRTCTAR